LAVYTHDGTIKEHVKFPTNRDYSLFVSEMKTTLAEMEHKEFELACSASPGQIDYEKGVGVAYGNLPWKNVALRENLSDLLGCTVLIENDAKLAALSEARLLGKSKYHKVLYITVSTGIGGGLITDGIIDHYLADAEIGHMFLEHDGVMQQWEEFASGSAIVRRFNQRASDITDPAIWKLIAHDIGVGLIDLLAVYQPDIVVFGGGAGANFEKFRPYLAEEMTHYKSPLIEIPPMVVAKNPEEAVVYGCYELMKDHANASKKAGHAHHPA